MRTLQAPGGWETRALVGYDQVWEPRTTARPRTLGYWRARVRELELERRGTRPSAPALRTLPEWRQRIAQIEAELRRDRR